MATRTFPETVEVFLETLFPGDDVSFDTAVQSRTRTVAKEYLIRCMNREEIVLTDIGKIGKVVAGIGNRKAPGPDGPSSEENLLAKARARCRAL